MTRIGTALVALAALAAVLLPAAAAAEDGFDRALSLVSEGRHAEARQVLDPLLESEPGNPQARLLHGVLRVQEGQRDEAIAVFSDLARKYPDMFEAHNNLAVVYVEEGRLDDARAVLAAILERHPNAIGYRNLGDIYVQLARSALARSQELGGGPAAVEEAGLNAGGGFLQASEAASSASRSAVAAKREDPAVPAASPGKAGQPVAALAEFCVVTAEFPDMNAAEEARQWFASLGAEPVRIARGSRETVKDYRVYLPAFESRELARAKMHELKEKGVRDVAVVLSGALRNAVSLGVYASEANAKRRTAQLEALGYAPVQEPHNTRMVAEYATVEARVGGSYEDLSDAWGTRFPGQPVRQVDCD